MMAIPTMERCMQDKYDRGGSYEDNTTNRGSIDEYDHQLYRRLQMTGQAREEEEEEDEVTIMEPFTLRWAQCGLNTH